MKLHWSAYTSSKHADHFHIVSSRPWQTRTHCCGHVVADTTVSPFACAKHLLRTQILSGTQKMFLILFGNILCPQPMFPSLRSMKAQHSFCVPRAVRAPKKHHEQQCVLVCQGLNVSCWFLLFSIPFCLTMWRYLAEIINTLKYNVFSYWEQIDYCFFLLIFSSKATTSWLVGKETIPPINEPENASDILKGLFQNYDKRLRPGHAGENYLTLITGHEFCMSIYYGWFMTLQKYRMNLAKFFVEFHGSLRHIFFRDCASRSLDSFFPSQSCLGFSIFSKTKKV